MTTELLPCPFCHCGTNALSISGDEVICGHCGATAELDVWNRRVAPEPSPSHMEMAIKVGKKCFGKDAKIEGSNFVHDLAAEFAAVAEEAEERGYSRGHDMGMDKAYGVSIPVNHKSFEQYLDEAREAATRAERERCAKVIELEQEFIECASTVAMNNRYGLTDEDTIHSAWLKVVSYFAAAIRDAK